jgi:hypothetical protein
VLDDLALAHLLGQAGRRAAHLLLLHLLLPSLSLLALLPILLLARETPHLVRARAATGLGEGGGGLGEGGGGLGDGGGGLGDGSGGLGEGGGGEGEERPTSATSSCASASISSRSALSSWISASSGTPARTSSSSMLPCCLVGFLARVHVEGSNRADKHFQTDI